MSLIEKIAGLHDAKVFQNLHWVGSFEDYLQLVKESPKITRTAFQRVYDMVLSYGKEEYIDNKKTLVHYPFFDDLQHGRTDAIFGLDIPLMRLVNLFNSAAMRYGTEKRVLLLHGPVGSAKSTIVRLLKQGLEEYSKTPSGALYTLVWTNLEGEEDLPCPMHEEPLRLIPSEIRASAIKTMDLETDGDFSIPVEGELCPMCRFMFMKLLEKYDGHWEEVVKKHIQVKRIILSEQDRIGIGTFQPKDEKNQDSTELTGDLNYRKIAIYGSDSDPRAFNFDGEFNIANRGIIEFIEVLKLDVAFLYDLLSASQEHKIKPKKFPQTDIDEVIIGHTNEPEYKKLQSNDYMEALRDRTVKVDIPYITKLSEEIKIYQKDFSQDNVPGIHIAPHTLETAAMWAVLTRLEEPKKAQLTLLQKLKLYDGKLLTGFTEDSVKELRKESKREGMEGISPRYVQDKISNALVADHAQGCINPFVVMNELESGLKHHSLINSDEQRAQYKELLGVVRQEYEEIVKNEVQRAISADEEALENIFKNYIDNIKAYTQKEKVKNPYTGQYEEPDERLMRAIEEKIGISESGKDDFRREIMNFIAARVVEKKPPFKWDTNDRLRRALELKLFEDKKDTIRLTSLVTGVADQESQDKIDVVKARLKSQFGYCEVCATDVLNFVASIFARGDTEDEEK
ncbi:MAG: serine protein kinase [Deltaproteobacteria bacterium]|nr:serine protein kinase [Deltaproteobacteria bacterium]